MDVFGVREALFQMAQRISECGYYVLVPNLFYREGGKISFSPTEAFQSEESKKEVYRMMQSLTMEKALSDTAAYISYLTAQENTKNKVACIGYCMGGKFALRAAGQFPDKISAVALFHATKLATDQPDSPHLLIPQMKAFVYIGIAEKDAHFSAEEKALLEKCFKKSKVNYKMKVYANVQHGFRYRM